MCSSVRVLSVSCLIKATRLSHDEDQPIKKEDIFLPGTFDPRIDWIGVGIWWAMCINLMESDGA